MHVSGAYLVRADRFSQRLLKLGIAASVALPLVASAQTQNPGLGLVGLPYANDVERAAAIANQEVFEALDVGCNPGGTLDVDPEPRMSPGSSCNADRFFVYLNARELVHTANELRGSGASVASLGTDLEGLGLALRWTAAEELAAQGSMATEFTNGQLSNLAARLSALRFGGRAFSVSSVYKFDPRKDQLLASAQETSSDAVDSTDGTRETFSRWGGFLNGAFGYGSKEPTPLEDAFDFDGSEVTIGIDYRFPSNVVVGAIFGQGEQAIDFDEAASNISVVDGNVDSEASSLILFALYQGERLNLSGSIGVQSLDYDIVRNIKYSSFNPDISSTNSIAISHPDSDNRMATFNFGYAITQNKFTVEPMLNVEYLDMTIDSFAEERSINLLSDTAVSRRLDLVISDQRVESVDVSAGMRFQYVLTPPFGVVVPYLTLDAHRELRDEARNITAGYAAIADILGSGSFVVPTDVPDEAYSVASIGFSVVMRGGRQREPGAPISGGLSAFFQLKTVGGLRHYDDNVMTGGFRYEF